MARSVSDLAWLLSVMAGPDPRDPRSLGDAGTAFLGSLQRDLRGVRLAWSERLGRYPVEPAVTEVCNSARRVLANLGCELVDAEPDFAGVDEIFQTLRAAGYATSLGHDLARQRALLKETVIWNVERGLALTPGDIARAMAEKTALERRVDRFLEQHEFLLLPVSQVVPFPVEVEWVREIEGTRMPTYIDWMATCYAVSCTGLPAISVPCGFTRGGLPVGLQIVGRRGRDREVLELAHAFERETRFAERRPPIAERAA